MRLFLWLDTWSVLCWNQKQDLCPNRSRGNQSTGGQGVSGHTGRPYPQLPPSSQIVLLGHNDQVRARGVVSLGSGDVRRLQRSSGTVRRHPHWENLRARAVCARGQSGRFCQVSLHRHVSRRQQVRLQVSVSHLHYFPLTLAPLRLEDRLHGPSSVRDA